MPPRRVGGTGKKSWATRPTYAADWRQRLQLAAGAGTKQEAARICKSVLNDMVIDDDRQLHDCTGVMPDNFDIACEAFENEVIRDGDAPMYRSKPGHGEDPGRRSDLLPRHMVFLYLETKRHSTSQKNTAVNYGIKQHTEKVHGGFLPTGDNMQEKIAGARTAKQVQAVAGDAMAHMARVAGRDEDRAKRDAGKTPPYNRMLRDGTHIPIGRPHDKDRRDEHRSGKKKAYTKNTVLVSNANGVFIGRSRSEQGSHNDKGTFNRYEMDYGLVSRVMAGKSKAMTIWEYIDRGFRGLAKNRPGSHVRMPAFRGATS